MIHYYACVFDTPEAAIYFLAHVHVLGVRLCSGKHHFFKSTWTIEEIREAEKAINVRHITEDEYYSFCNVE